MQGLREKIFQGAQRLIITIVFRRKFGEGQKKEVFGEILAKGFGLNAGKSQNKELRVLLPCWEVLQNT